MEDELPSAHEEELNEKDAQIFTLQESIETGTGTEAVDGVRELDETCTTPTNH